MAPEPNHKTYRTLWYFAAERQRTFFRRVNGDPPPWTEDSIIQKFKFTNAYRASDRVSQYLIKNVIYAGPQDPQNLFFRIILFKIFNKIETWRSLEGEFKSITASEFVLDQYIQFLHRRISSGSRIYSAAYIMPSGGTLSKGIRKHEFHLHLLESMLKERTPEKIAESRSMAEAFRILNGFPSIGKFLAYQYVTDLNYSNLCNFSESEFVVPGPGALDGISKCFVSPGRYNEQDLIKCLTEKQNDEFSRYGIDFPDLWGRPLQLIDVQNLLCEISKYTRVSNPEVAGRSNRTRIKQKYIPTQNTINYWYPPKWEINDKIHKVETLNN